MARRGAEADELGTHEQHRPSSRDDVAYRVHVVAGPDRGVELLMDSAGGPALLGTSSICALRLSDPAVSRRHLELTVVHGLLEVRDLASRNGTLINDLVVLSARLRGGELLQVGDTTLRVERGSSPPSETRAAHRTQLGRILGASDAMQPVFRELCAAVLDRRPVLVEGEPGTGKALLSQTLHDRSARAQGPFVVVRAEDLAPEDACDGDSGALAEARGGTLVLEELESLSAAAQAALRERLVELVRSSSTATPLSGQNDVRVVSTTCVRLEGLVDEGQFDAALLDLLAQRRIALPPLRERRGDIELLAAHFWQTFGAPQPMDPRQLVRLCELPWPGNVTELSREIARLVGRALDEASGVRKSLDDPRDFALPYSRARQRVLDRFERMYIERKLASCGGNVSRAAEEAGVARRYFQIVKSRHHL